jgi:hypothetical protein
VVVGGGVRAADGVEMVVRTVIMVIASLLWEMNEILSLKLVIYVRFTQNCLSIIIMIEPALKLTGPVSK